MYIIYIYDHNVRAKKSGSPVHTGLRDCAYISYNNNIIHRKREKHHKISK